MCAALRSVIPTLWAMSLRRASGSAAMQASTRPWFVTRLKRGAPFPELDFMDLITIVESPALESRLRGVERGWSDGDAQSCRARRSVDRSALENRCRGVGGLRCCRDRRRYCARHAQTVGVGAVDG